MSYAIRVRLYRGTALEADTDPDAAPGEPGSERVADLAATQDALIELCCAFHGAAVFAKECSRETPQLLGFDAGLMHVFSAYRQARAAQVPQFTYQHGYSVLTGPRCEMWRAQVDIAVVR